MSATARALRPDDDGPGAARTPSARTPGARSSSARTGSTRTSTARATAAPRSSVPGAVPASTVAPVRGRAHTAPVRAGALRARPSRPTPREVPAAAAEPRRRTATAGSPARRAPFVLLVVGMLLGTTLGLLFLNTAIAVDSLDVTAQRAANVERTQRLERLEQQVVAAGTPGAMAAAAAAAGLVPAGTAAYLVLGPDGEAILRGTAEPAEAPPPPAEAPPPLAEGDPQTPPAPGAGG